MKVILKQKMKAKGFAIGYELAKKMSKENPEAYQQLKQLFSRIKGNEVKY